MSLYEVQHPNRAATVMQCASLIAWEGYLHAMRYGGNFTPGAETVATWAPGDWTSFRLAESCPKCGKPVSQWD